MSRCSLETAIDCLRSLIIDMLRTNENRLHGAVTEQLLKRAVEIDALVVMPSKSRPRELQWLPQTVIVGPAGASGVGPAALVQLRSGFGKYGGRDEETGSKSSRLSCCDATPAPVSPPITQRILSLHPDCAVVSSLSLHSTLALRHVGIEYLEKWSCLQ